MKHKWEVKCTYLCKDILFDLLLTCVEAAGSGWCPHNLPGSTEQQVKIKYTFFINSSIWFSSLIIKKGQKTLFLSSNLRSPKQQWDVGGFWSLRLNANYARSKQFSLSPCFSTILICHHTHFSIGVYTFRYSSIHWKSSHTREVRMP